MSLKNATKLENGRVELEIEVDAETFAAAVNAAYKKDVKKISVPGFRKGKAPRKLIEKMYGTGVFYEDALNDLLGDLYWIREKHIIIVHSDFPCLEKKDLKSYLDILEDNINDNKRYYDGQRLYVVFPEKQQ